MLSIFIFTAASAMLIAACWDLRKRRGIRATIAFFTLAIVLSYLKEWIEIGSADQEYFYNVALVSIFGVPLLPVVGWTLTWFIGWSFADAIILRRSKPTFYVALPAAAMGAAVSFTVESSLIAAGLWTWRHDRGCLLYPPFFWFLVSALFLSFFLTVVYGTRWSRAMAALCVLMIFLRNTTALFDFPPFNLHQTWIFLLSLVILLFLTRLEYETIPCAARSSNNS